MGDDEKQGNDGKDGRHDGEILRPRGDYQTLLSYQKAEVVYDLTFRFAHKYLSKGDRTVDQTNYLLDQQIRTLEKEFLEQGGLRERMYEARQRHRRKQPRPPEHP